MVLQMLSFSGVFQKGFVFHEGPGKEGSTSLEKLARCAHSDDSMTLTEGATKEVVRGGTAEAQWSSDSTGILLTVQFLESFRVLHVDIEAGKHLLEAI